jgi:hypothetical protein
VMRGRKPPGFVIPGCAAWRRPGIHTPGVSLKGPDKDLPTPDLFFNQTNLPVSPPFLEFFFASDGSCNIIINLEPHEFVDAVSRRKTGVMDSGIARFARALE